VTTKKAAAGKADDPAQILLSEVTRQFGPGSLIQLGSHVSEPVDVISTSSVGLDHALGIGGLPRGRVTEIYGPEGSGKTTLALHAIANAQKAGGLAVMIDAEHALDMDYAQVLGVDTDHLLLDQPDTGEQGLEIADMCIRSGVVDIIVIDSVAALVPKAEIEGMMGDSHIGLQARLMSQALRKLTPAVAGTKTACIFINQLREKVGVVFGNPEVTSGGKALKFYASVRLDIRKVETVKVGTVATGQKVRIRVVKNKLAPPFREWTAEIIYGRGISRETELVDLSVQYGLLRKSGAFFTFQDGVTAHGSEKARLRLEEFPGVADELARQLRPLMAAAAPRVTRAAPVPSPDDLAVPEGSLADIPPGGNDPETQ
jgi:recombination protein RecA